MLGRLATYVRAEPKNYPKVGRGTPGLHIRKRFNQLRPPIVVYLDN
jgi:hypothetical protein